MGPLALPFENAAMYSGGLSARNRRVELHREHVIVDILVLAAKGGADTRMPEIIKLGVSR